MLTDDDDEEEEGDGDEALSETLYSTFTHFLILPSFKYEGKLPN